MNSSKQTDVYNILKEVVSVLEDLLDLF